MALHENQRNYFAHDADIGIIGEGKTIEQAFEQAAVAMFGIMADLTTVKAEQEIQFSFEEKDIELAFVTWLNRLLAESYRLNRIFCQFQVIRKADTWYGKAWGQPWSKAILHGIEVKGATLTMLSVKEKSQVWVAKCVVDV